MNYYPYYIPYTTFPPVAKGGLKSLLGNIKWGSILSGTQKTLNIINQAIPIINQAIPVINNAKTMFKVMKEFKKVDLPQTNQIKQNIQPVIDKKIQNGPVFFQE